MVGAIITQLAILDGTPILEAVYLVTAAAIVLRPWFGHPAMGGGGGALITSPQDFDPIP
jgi:hypothetical protein